MPQVGSKKKPYNLHWPAHVYQKVGTYIGFDFSRRKLDASSTPGKVLGVRRYKPSEDTPVELGIPEGTYVRCHLLAEK